MDAIEILKIYKKELENKFGLKEIGVFGSFARGTESMTSDVDILVEFEKPVNLFEFIEVKFFLENLFGRTVDLVTKDALKPRLRDRILNEVVYV